MLRQERAGAGDDGDVEAKKQAAERGGGGQKEDIANVDVSSSCNLRTIRR